MGKIQHALAATLLLGAGFVASTGVVAQTASNPVLFVTQYPVPYDFAAIGSVFANQFADMASVGRGGDLYIRYPNGVVRNLTREAGFGIAGTAQDGPNAIAVRDPAVHWSGTKAVFSMVRGAPTQQYQYLDYYWQLYEVTGLGIGETVSITPVANQPAQYNNIQPTYGSDGDIIFVSDRPRSGDRHLYPQHDEYESTATPTGLWKIDAQSGALQLLQHSPSGSFTPIVDSYGRVLFTRWDHLQRDQQNEGAGNPYNTFNYASEANGAPTADRSEVFPEPRIAAQGSTVEGFTINQFFPWQLNQDGTGEETVNHVGRHELHDYFNRSFNNDPNLVEFIDDNSGRANQNPILNALYLREDPTQAGRYYAVDAPEFDTHGSGQVIRFSAVPGANPANFTIDYITHPATGGTVPGPNHTGHYRNPLPLANGSMLVAHATQQGGAGNDGTRENPVPRYNYRLRFMQAGGGGYQAAGTTLLPGSGVVRSIQYWDPDYRIVYNGPMWELSPVEVVARTPPPMTGETIAAPEQNAFTLESVVPSAFRAWLRQNNLAVIVVRDATTRDARDRQQPFNLRVAGGATTVGAGGTIYDIAYMQMFQGDQVRGIRGAGNAGGTPKPGRRVLAQVMHDPHVMPFNPPNTGPAGSAPIESDGSVALFVPTRRALSWQTTAANGTPVVRERYWITLQPGEIRACDGCHGINQQNQAGAVAATNTPAAFREMLATWRDTLGIVFVDDFE